MCPMCLAAMVGQVLFLALPGFFLVLISDWKIGLPMTLFTAGLGWVSYTGAFPVPAYVLLGNVAFLIVRATLLLRDPNHWVRYRAENFGGWVRRQYRKVTRSPASISPTCGATEGK